MYERELNIKKQIQSNNFIILSFELINNIYCFGIRCNNCSFIWYTNEQSILQNPQCPRCCNRRVPHIIEEVIHFVRLNNGVLFSDQYINNFTRLHIKCNICNYEWHPTFHGLLEGDWCINCSRSRKYLYKEVKNIIKDHNGTLLSKKYRNNHFPLKILCNICHKKFKLSLSDVLCNHWCKFCARNRQKKRSKYSKDFVEKLLQNKGGKLLGPYINTKYVFKVQCSKGHCWQARFFDVLKGRWCKKCAGLTKYTIKEARKIIKLYGNSILLSKKYKNATSPLKVLCNDCEIIWKTSINNVKCGHGCPNCNVHKRQKKLTEILTLIFPKSKGYIIKNNYKEFDWLISPKGKRQEIDILIYKKDKTFVLAVEHDGQQHFYPVAFKKMSKAQTLKEFKYLKQLDKNKNKLIKQHSKDIHYFVRFSYKDKLTKEAVIRKLINKKVPKPCLI